MTETVTVITIMHYDDQAGLASVWLVPREVKDEVDDTTLSQIGMLVLGPAPYVSTQQLESSLARFLALLHFRVIHLLWGDE